MAKKTVEIKLIENQAEGHYRVTVDGIDQYSPFTFDPFGDPDKQTDARIAAKAVAFDECLQAQMNGPIRITYHSI